MDRRMTDIGTDMPHVLLLNVTRGARTREPLLKSHRDTLGFERLRLIARQTVEGGIRNGTARTRGVVRGVTTLQDGIGCYATGHQSYLYTRGLFFFFFPPPQALL